MLRERFRSGKTSKTREFVATRDGVEVGLLIYEDWGQPTAFLYEIFVLPEARRSGDGTWLLSFAEQIALALGRTSIRLHARSLAQDEWRDEELTMWYESKGYVRTTESGMLEKPL